MKITKTVYVVCRPLGKGRIENLGIFSSHEKAVDLIKTRPPQYNLFIVDVELDREVSF